LIGPVDLVSNTPSPARRNRRRHTVLASHVRVRLAVLTLLATLAAQAPAQAAFRGKDGVLAYAGKAAGQLYLRDAGGRGAGRVTVPGHPQDPAFSPRGQRLAYATGDGRLWISLLAGGNPLPLATGVKPSREPAWSPAGDRIAFAGGRRGARDLFSIEADGSGLSQLTFAAADEYAPAWSSRDEIAFVYRSGRSRGDIATIAGHGGRSRRITHGRADDESPTWSPGGRWLAFTRDGSLYVMRADGHRVRRLTRLKRPVGSPAWSPDGRSIAFASGRAGHRALYTIRSNGRRLRRVPGSRADARAVDWQPQGADPVIAAAGDIACDPGSQSFQGGAGTDAFCHELATSNLLLRRDLSGVLVLGDAQYEDAQYTKFLQSFDPTWGRLKAIEHPTVGNHEIRTPGAQGYFDYFDGIGAVDGAGGPRNLGYYSFDIGTWHLISLNSECAGGVCAFNSPQERWLRADLAAHPAACTLAFWHRPFVTSGIRKDNTAVIPLWQDLYDYNADLVLNGHVHNYERLAPMTPAATPDPVRGVRSFVVGTGGKDRGGYVTVQPTSEVRDSVFGVLMLTLHPSSYDWQFVNEFGRVIDAGTNACH
jgi:Tol biopolymer transport system component